MIFKDRREAGKKLAEALRKYNPDFAMAQNRGSSIPSKRNREKDTVIVALPRGGIVVGRKVANALGAPLDIIVPRKIGAPTNEEYAIGAVAESGDVVWNEDERGNFNPDELKKIVEKQKKEANRRLILYRRGLPPRDFKNKTLIIVDDGVATGYTMRAAIKTAKTHQPKKIVVAVPCAPSDTLKILKKEADEVVTLDIPEFFGAVGNCYEDFPQVEDETVIKLLKR